MRKGTVTYNSPPGDNRQVTMGGITFHDGKPVEVNSYDNPHLISKLEGNPNFEVKIGKETDEPPPKRKVGRPSNADIAAAKVAAEQAEKEAKEAKDKAAAAKSDHEKLSKATDKEVTRPPAEGAKASIKEGQAQATGHDFEKDRQADVARRDAQAKGIGPIEDRPDNQRNFAGVPGQGQAGQGVQPPGQGQYNPHPDQNS